VNVTLIGYRATGKSTVARHLALLLGWDWVDADVEIELRAGKSIATLFAEQGEPAFRDLESQVLADLAGRQRTVLAVGGGAVLRPRNREALRRGGRMVWLTARPETIVQRLATDPATAARRPSLTTSGGADEVHRLLAERTSVYRGCADLEIATDEKSPVAVAAEIAARLGLAQTAQETT
jgi:shikimate kinase